jgi:hypothetical protein
MDDKHAVLKGPEPLDRLTKSPSRYIYLPAIKHLLQRRLNRRWSARPTCQAVISFAPSRSGHPVGVLFVFELSEVEVRCTKDQSEEILERIIDRRLSAVKADENPGDIQFRGFQPPSAPNRVGFSASRSAAEA